MTVDPQSAGYDPSPLIGYCKSLGVTYHYEEQGMIFITETFQVELPRENICQTLAHVTFLMAKKP